MLHSWLGFMDYCYIEGSNNLCLGKCINKKLQSPHFEPCNLYLHKIMDSSLEYEYGYRLL